MIEMTQMTQTPVKYSPGLEHSEPDEAKTGLGLQEAFRGIIETTSKDTGHGFRAVHAKSHALLQATLIVPSDLPPRLAQGLFAKAGRYTTFMRFSNSWRTLAHFSRWRASSF